MDWLNTYENATELYTDAVRRWPINREQAPGKWILASYDDESIIVYQAYNENIAKYASENHRFIGCPDYSNTRMTCKGGEISVDIDEILIVGSF